LFKQKPQLLSVVYGTLYTIYTYLLDDSVINILR